MCTPKLEHLNLNSTKSNVIAADKGHDKTLETALKIHEGTNLSNIQHYPPLPSLFILARRPQKHN